MTDTQTLGLRAEVKREADILAAAISRFQGILSNAEIYEAITPDERSAIFATILTDACLRASGIPSTC